MLPIVGSSSAFADYAPQPGDIVGIGGDTPQYAVDFGLNGSNGILGFNSSATVNRVISFFATPDSERPQRIHGQRDERSVGCVESNGCPSGGDHAGTQSVQFG